MNRPSPTPFSFREKPTCRNCGADLKTHQQRREEFCSHARCRPASMAYLLQKAKEHKQREADARDANDIHLLIRACKNDNVSLAASNKAILLVVPDNQYSVVKQTEERKNEFLAHLEQIMQGALELIANVEEHESIQAGHEYRAVQQETSLPVINACSTCRGVCCFRGKGHAFLTKDLFAWRMLNEVDVSPEAQIEDYMSRIPEYAYENSCVYHGPEGCVLPREIRGSICNSFLCTGITDGLRRAKNRDTCGSIAITETDGVQRVGLSNADGSRTEISLTLSPPLQ